LLAAAALTAVAGVLLTPSSPSTSGTPTAAAAAPDPLTANIIRAQQRLRQGPGDYLPRGPLGRGHGEKARGPAAPRLYPKAEGALRRSLEVRPDGNDQALTGLGALANARHDFAAARDYARKALALNAYSADAYAVLTDAETQLGSADAATEAVRRMLDL